MNGKTLNTDFSLFLVLCPQLPISQTFFNYPCMFELLEVNRNVGGQLLVLYCKTTASDILQVGNVVDCNVNKNL